MKRWYWLLRIESFLVLLIYPLVALASLMSLSAAADYTPANQSAFDTFMINSFLWLTLIYPAFVILAEVLNWNLRREELWSRAVIIQLLPVGHQFICVLLAVYCVYWGTV